MDQTLFVLRAIGTDSIKAANTVTLSAAGLGVSDGRRHPYSRSYRTISYVKEALPPPPPPAAARKENPNNALHRRSAPNHISQFCIWFWRAL